MEKPPIGIMPKEIWIEKRIYTLKTAIERYELNNYEVPQKWINELNELEYKLKLEE